MAQYMERLSYQALTVLDTSWWFDQNKCYPQRLQNRYTSIITTRHIQCILEGPFWEEKCKWRAQKVLFWPQMNKNVKAMWQKCKTCSKYAPSKPKELMILHEVPTYPWQKLGTDLFKLIKVIWLLQIIIHYGQMFTCLHACK